MKQIVAFLLLASLIATVSVHANGHASASASASASGSSSGSASPAGSMMAMMQNALAAPGTSKETTAMIKGMMMMWNTQEALLATIKKYLFFYEAMLKLSKLFSRKWFKFINCSLPEVQNSLFFMENHIKKTIRKRLSVIFKPKVLKSETIGSLRKTQLLKTWSSKM